MDAVPPWPSGLYSGLVLSLWRKALVPVTANCSGRILMGGDFYGWGMFVGGRCLWAGSAHGQRIFIGRECS